jgi:hypothetical protein
MLTHIRWLRVVVAAFLVEVGLVVTGIPPLLVFGDIVLTTVVPVLCVVVPFVVAWLATRKLSDARVLHGVLIGIVATAMYFVLVVAQGSIAEAAAAYGLPLFICVNALRIVSAAAGGYFADRRAAAVPSAA